MDRRDFLGGFAAVSGLLLRRRRPLSSYEANSDVRLAALGVSSRGTHVGSTSQGTQGPELWLSPIYYLTVPSFSERLVRN